MRKLVFLKAILFSSIVLFCTSSLIANAQTGSFRKVASPTSATLESVYMISPTDGWAAGFDGSIIKWDGTKWKNVESPTTATLKSLDMVSSNEGWAIAGDVSGYGNNNSIIRWEGE